MRKKLIAGNWKMHKNQRETADFFAELLEVSPLNKPDIYDQADVLFAVPYLYLTEAKRSVKNAPIKIAAQNVHFADQGAYTGEISLNMLKDVGIDVVLLGHSERRQLFGETNELIAQKAEAAAAHRINFILCVGETLAEREANQTLTVIQKQLEAVLVQLENTQFLTIAYEPVWAIGTGRNATTDQANEVHKAIRQMLIAHYSKPVAETIRILYGGSVKSSNAQELLAQSEIDGVLVGGSSLDPKEFAAIVQSVVTLN